MKPLFFNISIMGLVAGLLLSASHARADGALTPINFKGIYEFRFSGIPFGRMGLQIEQTPDHYAIACDIMSTGLLKLLVQHTSHTVVDASGSGYRYSRIEYETHYQTRKKKHYVGMSYKDGVLTAEKLVPPENPKKRPPVPAALKNAAADPLSFILKIRQSLLAAQRDGKSSFYLNVYDGRRLTEADFTVKGAKRIIYDNRPTQVTELDVRRKLLAGYTASERADTDPRRESTLRMYFSGEAQMMPVKLEAGFMLGTLTATLAKQCRTGESCLLGLQD